MDQTILNNALAVPYGSPLHHFATQVCLLREIHPDAYQPRLGCPPMMNWQAVVAEFMLFHMALPPSR